MIAIPAGLAAFASTWWRAALGFILAAPLFFLLGQCDGKKIERKAWEAKVAKLTLKAEKVARAADELHRKAQALQQQRIATDRQEVEDVVSQIPDGPTTARQRARACLELVRQARARNLPEPAC